MYYVVCYLWDSQLMGCLHRADQVQQKEKVLNNLHHPAACGAGLVRGPFDSSAYAALWHFHHPPSLLFPWAQGICWNNTTLYKVDMTYVMKCMIKELYCNVIVGRSLKHVNQTYFCWQIRLFLRLASYTCLWTGWHSPSITGKALGRRLLRTVELIQRDDAAGRCVLCVKSCHRLPETGECVQRYAVQLKSVGDVSHDCGFWENDALVSWMRLFPFTWKDLGK